MENEVLNNKIYSSFFALFLHCLQNHFLFSYITNYITLYIDFLKNLLCKWCKFIFLSRFLRIYISITSKIFYIYKFISMNMILFINKNKEYY